MADEREEAQRRMKAVATEVRSAAARGAADAASEEENRASARKGALFLAAVVAVYVVYLVVSGQMATFVEALSGVDLRWVAGAALCFVMYFVFGVLAYAIAVYLDHDSPVGILDLMSVEA